MDKVTRLKRAWGELRNVSMKLAYRKREKGRNRDRDAEKDRDTNRAVEEEGSRRERLPVLLGSITSRSRALGVILLWRKSGS